MRHISDIFLFYEIHAFEAKIAISFRQPLSSFTTNLVTIVFFRSIWVYFPIGLYS